MQSQMASFSLREAHPLHMGTAWGGQGSPAPSSSRPFVGTVVQVLQAHRGSPHRGPPLTSGQPGSQQGNYSQQEYWILYLFAFISMFMGKNPPLHKAYHRFLPVAFERQVKLPSWCKPHSQKYFGEQLDFFVHLREVVVRRQRCQAHFSLL